jgi:hypothetical protein
MAVIATTFGDGFFGAKIAFCNAMCYILICGGVTMMLITNPVFSDVEKAHLAFVLAHPFPGRSDVIEQINSMKSTDITRDVTAYYWIMEFRPDRVNQGYGPMHPCVALEVLHGDGTAPTEFNLYQRNGFVFELEIYNADHSTMNLDTIMDGEILIRSANQSLVL